MNKYFLMPTLALLIGLTAVHAEEATPGAGNNVQQQDADRQERRDRGRSGWMERIVRDNPELEGVDLQSEEGQAKLRAVMAKRMQQRIAERRTEEREAMKQQLGFNDEEFSAIQPLLDRVEFLRLNQRLVVSDGNRGGNNRGRGGRGNRGGGFGGFDRNSALLGDQEMDPLATAVKEASDALKALLEDPQASDEEITSLVAQVRESRKALEVSLKTARAELRSVLTAKQEALLLQRGVLD